MSTTLAQATKEEIKFAGHPTDDQKLFSEIYDRYSPALLGLILKWVKNVKTAELLLYHAFIQAWQNRKSFDSQKDTSYSWLCRLARNCYNNSVTDFYDK